VERIRAAAAAQRLIHHVEEVISRRLLARGQDFLRAFPARAGDGDAGPTLTVPGDAPSEPTRVGPRLDAPRDR